ncbi:Aste57867_11497 [Aphanomyces stellatus]|uniref:Aste57867_11497 protein n=1 Tax=Aphanomyces stellatus TaxID=120398 RepID=A0A485KT58_9STRA|nr:hypothetical protein As57867_011454 [Aphanomyces stellatus]VFT88358.1 Aste57867_11497 [Aphanomyces stellatus]
MATPICFFNDCSNPVDGPGAWKCQAHKHRNRCLVDSCTNQMYARNLCIRHGGKRQCGVESCNRNVRVGDLCSRHAVSVHTKLRCNEHACPNVARKHGKCVRHGGGKQCKVSTCHTHARKDGFCSRHASSSQPLILLSPPPSVLDFEVEMNWTLGEKPVDGTIVMDPQGNQWLDEMNFDIVDECLVGLPFLVVL